MQFQASHRILLPEEILLSKGSDGDQAVQRLTEVLKYRAICQGVQALELTAAGNI
jgi:hypothetical protein